MEDLNPVLEGSPYIFYQTLGQEPHRKLIVMWCQCPVFECMSDPVTFQIVLKEGISEENDSIEIHIYSKPLCADWIRCTIGLQDINGSKFTIIPTVNRNCDSWGASKESYRFTPTSDDTYEVHSIPFMLEPIAPGDKISYAWYQGSEYLSDQQQIVVTPTESTTYTARITLCSGHQFVTEHKVFVFPHIPDAFTPNGDGLNDRFTILGVPPENITKYNLQIFNRWGQLVFSSTEITESWDGTLKGQDAAEGVYSWVIFYEDNKKFKTSNKGTLLLYR
jgi:gliding motility-associated-like protein